MIDLSFLTEEEQESILAVLNRDASLKKAEEQRVQWVTHSGQWRLEPYDESEPSGVSIPNKVSGVTVLTAQRSTVTLQARAAAENTIHTQQLTLYIYQCCQADWKHCCLSKKITKQQQQLDVHSVSSRFPRLATLCFTTCFYCDVQLIMLFMATHNSLCN